MGEDEPPEGSCHRVGSIAFLGAKRAVCEERKAGFVIRSVKTRYLADIEAEAVLTLISRPERLQNDMDTFQATAATFRTCRSIWHDGKRTFTIGQGQRCPRGRWF